MGKGFPGFPFSFYRCFFHPYPIFNSLLLENLSNLVPARDLGTAALHEGDPGVASFLDRSISGTYPYFPYTYILFYAQ
jgi:hypothetical protein